MELKNKVAIVTGAGSGIGEAIAKTFAKAGAKVVVADIDVEAGQKVVSAIKKTKGKAVFVEVDTSSPDDSNKAVQLALDEFGRLDIAVNNAGIGGAQAATGKYSIEEWEKVISINLSGVFYGMHFQLKEMGKQKRGTIINMASVLGSVGTPLSPAYVAAKHGVIGLTKSSALAYADKGIRINSIGPGYIETPLLANNLDKKQLKGLKELHPMKRLGTVQEIADLALFLASDKASFSTGSYYTADGGYLSQ